MSEESLGERLVELADKIENRKVETAKPSGSQNPSNRSIWREVPASIVDLFKVIAIIVGVYLSVLSFTSTAQKEAATRLVEACQPLQGLRRDLYNNTMKVAEVLANSDEQAKKTQEYADAQKRFRELYVVELSMVEPGEVEAGMVQFAKVVDPDLIHLSDAQRAALNLAHSLRASYSAGCPTGQ
jgi:hypothetical protein